jgi:hypothetical protein
MTREDILLNGDLLPGTGTKVQHRGPGIAIVVEQAPIRCVPCTLMATARNRIFNACSDGSPPLLPRGPTRASLPRSAVLPTWRGA